MVLAQAESDGPLSGRAGAFCLAEESIWANWSGEESAAVSAPREVPSETGARPLCAEGVDTALTTAHAGTVTPNTITAVIAWVLRRLRVRRRSACSAA